MRRFSAAATLALLALLAIGGAEAALLALLMLFSVILKLRLGVELGPGAALFGQSDGCCAPQVTIFNAGTDVSIVITAGSAVLAAVWRFGRWRPAT
ncbi:MAG TPA: hypothetical protein VFL27_00345 [Candidatus Dormibacteraeota bacterium]|nr:hypothetical protein [Candidatus Dormibacteraeota bacterium]